MKRIKIGFLVEDLRGLGITNPEADFLSARLKRWTKKVGDIIAKGELLIEVETDKVDAELTSAWTGIIAVIDYEEGEEWEVGVDKNGNELSERSEDTPFGKILLPALGYIEVDGDEEESSPPSETSAEPVVEVSPEESDPEKAEAVSQEVSTEDSDSERVRAAPVARRMATEHGIDINTIKGMSAGGRVMLADVERAIVEQAEGEKPKITEEIAGKKEKPKSIEEIASDREPLNATKIRKAIAYYLKKSHEEIVKAGDSITIDVTNLWKFYKQRREIWREDTGTDFSMTGIFMFLATRLLHDQRESFGIINAYWDKNEEEGYLFKHVNIGIAIQTPEGLMVPVMHSAETLSFREFMAQVNDKVQRAMSKKITLPELHDLTFTVNNVGAKGGENPDSIVPYTKESSGKERPTGMIMVLGAIKQFPDDKFIAELVRLGVIESKSDFDVRTLMTLAFSFDHRLFDGVPALEFVGAIKKYIEEKDDPEEFRELFGENFSIK